MMMSIQTVNENGDKTNSNIKQQNWNDEQTYSKLE